MSSMRFFLVFAVLKCLQFSLQFQQVEEKSKMAVQNFQNMSNFAQMQFFELSITMAIQ